MRRNASEVHDASREFHVTLARATHNSELVATLEPKWIIEVGRRLLARRAFEPQWHSADIAEHRAITDAVERRDGPTAEALMRAHIGAAWQHWDPLVARGDTARDAVA